MFHVLLVVTIESWERGSFNVYQAVCSFPKKHLPGKEVVQENLLRHTCVQKNYLPSIFLFFSLKYIQFSVYLPWTSQRIVWCDHHVSQPSDVTKIPPKKKKSVKFPVKSPLLGFFRPLLGIDTVTSGIEGSRFETYPPEIDMASETWWERKTNPFRFGCWWLFRGELLNLAVVPTRYSKIWKILKVPPLLLMERIQPTS